MGISIFMHPPNGTFLGITHKGPIFNNGQQGLVFILPNEAMPRDVVGLFFILMLPNFKVKN